MISMKLDKNVVQRRLDLMAAEGVVRYLTHSPCLGSFAYTIDVFLDFRSERSCGSGRGRE